MPGRRCPNALRATIRAALAQTREMIRRLGATDDRLARRVLTDMIRMNLEEDAELLERGGFRFLAIGLRGMSKDYARRSGRTLNWKLELERSLEETRARIRAETEPLPPA